MPVIADRKKADSGRQVIELVRRPAGILDNRLDDRILNLIEKP